MHITYAYAYAYTYAYAYPYTYAYGYTVGPAPTPRPPMHTVSQSVSHTYGSKVYVYAYVYVCVCVYVYDICMVAKCLRTCVGSYGIIHMHAYRGRSGGQGRGLLPLSSLARDPRALALSVPGGSHVNGHAQRPG